MISICNAVNWLLGRPTDDPVFRLLNAWRLWVTLAIFGALVGVLAYALFPPHYRSRATVVVDFNLEDMLPGYNPRKTFNVLDRETRKIEEIAWADDTLSIVAAKSGAADVSELRFDKLFLSQPSDGGWHFWAQDADPQRAQELAAIWIETFIQNVRQAVELSADVEDARQALADAVYLVEETDLELIERLTQQLSDQFEKARGVTPYVGVTLTQAANLPVNRTIPLSIYMFIGSGLAVASIALVLLFSARRQLSENNSG